LIDLANHILQQLIKDGMLYPDAHEEMAIPTLDGLEAIHNLP
jgi:hypothetical protein